MPDCPNEWNAQEYNHAHRPVKGGRDGLNVDFAMTTERPNV